MSELCLFNIKNYDVKYDTLNAFANEMIKFALVNDLGVHFNVLGYSHKLIDDNKMKCYFIVSDSFLHYNASFLDMSQQVYLSMEEYKRHFYINFYFFNHIIDLLKKYKIKNAEIYLSEDGSVESDSDFVNLISNGRNLLDILFTAIINSSNEYAFEFPTVKIKLIL